MACDINGGCKVCPGMWIAAAILAVMAIQNLFWRPTAPTMPLAVDSTNAVEQTSAEVQIAEPQIKE